MQSILLLHGALGSPADLAPLAQNLTSLGFKVHTLAFSGHGTSAFGSAFGIPAFTEELNRYIKNNGLHQAPVFGYSMGGFVALELAARSGTLSGPIITLGTKFNWSAEAVAKETAGLNPEVLAQKVPAFAAALEQKHGAAWKELVTKTAALMQEINTLNLLTPEVLRSIQNKTLIGLGDKDKMVSIEETVPVYKTLPNAAMYMLPNTKHPLESVHVPLLAQIILDFVKA